LDWAACGGPKSPEEFGRALHALQDYYRHRGLGYTIQPGFAGVGQALGGWIWYGEELDATKLLRSLDFGHGVTAVYYLVGFSQFNPDAGFGALPTDVDVEAEAREWLERYLREYLAWYIGQSQQGS